MREVPWVPSDVGDDLEAEVQATLGRLEDAGLTAQEADEFIRECVFNAWMDWDYQPKAASS
jgi:hypothetical protein